VVLVVLVVLMALASPAAADEGSWTERWLTQSTLTGNWFARATRLPRGASMSQGTGPRGPTSPSTSATSSPRPACPFRAAAGSYVPPRYSSRHG